MICLSTDSHSTCLERSTVLFSKKVAFLGIFMASITCMAQAQNRISGNVVDEQRRPLTGVNVSVKNSNHVTLTNTTGDYSIKALPTDTLIYTFVGYLPQRRLVGDLKAINIQLYKDNIQIDQVVVVGYGKQKQPTVTGSVSVVERILCKHL